MYLDERVCPSWLYLQFHKERKIHQFELPYVSKFTANLYCTQGEVMSKHKNSHHRILQYFFSSHTDVSALIINIFGKLGTINSYVLKKGTRSVADNQTSNEVSVHFNKSLKCSAHSSGEIRN